ncbi:piriformospora indica-insensitive protein 2-like [Zingiber officinale]|uniref:Piriformospora indica-insensitive protein 2 n=1 Tax=Zingiber officinale TaxID=94328 RepID=A0A8J5EZA2_ZINOF|nr:piriformospora indica-insensitive protein 2-like [Zingiber officinale]KAG6477933.1 hypothetical protein ZIOFF_061365 [Zingiber officinale]
MWKITSLSFLLLVNLLLQRASAETESSVAPMDKAEKEALYSVIRDLVGVRWNGSDLYPDPCGWTQIQGVSCDLFDGLWYVTSLNVGPILDNSLECSSDAKFNPKLFHLRHLKSLSVSDCFSSRRQPLTIPSSDWERLAPTLESLELRSNRGLAGQIPANLGQLGNLNSLVLADNALTGELPVALAGLVRLKRLMLSLNKFSGRVPAPLFAGMAQLLILDLSSNYLTGPLPASLANLSSLLKLDLSNNQFQGSLPPELRKLTHLSLLDLRNNSLSGELPRLESLQDLLLAYNPWGGNLLEFEWANLQNLSTLYLSHMGLRGAIPDAITSLKRLRYLALDGNQLSGGVSAKFSHLPYLTALYLNGNNLSGQLEFPGGFYERMGKRFASWNNPNLCYSTALAIASGINAPCGVPRCERDQQHSTEESKSSQLTENGSPEEHSALWRGIIILVVLL